jgi:hypothetical protein
LSPFWNLGDSISRGERERKYLKRDTIRKYGQKPKRARDMESSTARLPKI